ncbi:uncharacterized protein LOC136089238 isoform X2 [Hydra vulgaris]|uniref:Uncharacterized protein LOC136089238 isoform X2 n=1 Tax=Hydra vulgaris TaxID=6087 RepID=A0ABM4D9V3_HYDVU
MSTKEEHLKSDVSLGRRLIGNWFEEGILMQREAESLCASNKEPIKDRNNVTFFPKAHGKRREIKTKELLDDISKTVYLQFHPPPLPDDYKTTTMCDFTKDFVPDDRVPIQQHDLVHEQPASYWIENRDQIHGVTSSNSFRKNCTFSTVISEYKCSLPR